MNIVNTCTHAFVAPPTMLLHSYVSCGEISAASGPSQRPFEKNTGFPELWTMQNRVAQAGLVGVHMGPAPPTSSSAPWERRSPPGAGTVDTRHTCRLEAAHMYNDNSSSPHPSPNGGTGLCQCIHPYTHRVCNCIAASPQRARIR